MRRLGSSGPWRRCGGAPLGDVVRLSCCGRVGAHSVVVNEPHMVMFGESCDRGRTWNRCDVFGVTTVCLFAIVLVTRAHLELGQDANANLRARFQHREIISQVIQNSRGRDDVEYLLTVLKHVH
jgi:hypothetical protein